MVAMVMMRRQSSSNARDLLDDKLSQSLQSIWPKFARAMGELPREATSAQGQGQRHCRGFVTSCRQFERPATDIGDQQLPRRPTEPPSSREEGGGGFLCPGQHCYRHTHRLANARQHAPTVSRLANSRSSKGDQSIHSLFRSQIHTFSNTVNESVHRRRIQRPISVQRLHEIQPHFVRGHRQGRGTVMRIHHQQMHGVGANIQHAQSHDETVVRHRAWDP